MLFVGRFDRGPARAEIEEDGNVEDVDDLHLGFVTDYLSVLFPNVWISTQCWT